MPPKSKSKPKKSTPPPKAKGKRTPQAVAREPEALNERTVAADKQPADGAPVRTTPIKTERSLDLLAEYLSLQAEPLVPVRDAVAKAYGGTCMPDRELSTLKIVKDDDRFVIERTPDGVNRIGLVNVVAKAVTGTALMVTKGQTTETSNAAAAPTKTLGEHVAAAKGGPQRITWNADIGSSVLLLTEGQPPRKALIRNIANHGAFALYDLNLGGAGGTIDGVPASRIGRDLDAEGEVERWRMRCQALERHCDKGETLSQKIAERGAVARQLADALLKEKHAISELEQQLAEHWRAEPGQTDLRDLVGDGAPAKPAPGPARGEKMKAPPAAAEDKLADAPPAPKGARDVVELKEVGLTMEQLQASAVNQATASTGKPQQVKPVKPKGLGDHVLGHVQKGVAVLLPLYSKEEWAADAQEVFGFPRALPDAEFPERLAKGGKLNGLPVRVGRAARFVGPEANALLVRVPPLQLATPPEAKPVGKDAAAGT
jgi:hypothetical protein